MKAIITITIDHTPEGTVIGLDHQSDNGVTDMQDLEIAASLLNRNITFNTALLAVQQGVSMAAQQAQAARQQQQQGLFVPGNEGLAGLAQLPVLR